MYRNLEHVRPDLSCPGHRGSVGRADFSVRVSRFPSTIPVYLVARKVIYYGVRNGVLLIWL